MTLATDRAERLDRLKRRFWPKVDVRGVDECWLWTAAHTRQGYGLIRNGEGKCEYAHRVMLMLAGHDIKGREVRHTCDNPPCVNPAHLLPGTHAENMADMVARGRNAGVYRLTIKQVDDIRAGHQAGETQTALARRHGVGRCAVSNIINGNTWKWHVTGD